MMIKIRPFRGGFFTSNPGTLSPHHYSNPFSERPELLRFFYKFNSVESDSAWVGIQLFNYDSITPDLSLTERIDTIAYTETYIKESVSEYTEFVLPLEYVSEDFPGFMWIGFRTGEDYVNTNYHAGTTLWVDEVGVIGGTLSTHERSKHDNSISVYPNPASSEFRVQSRSGVEVKSVQIFDYSGREIKAWFTQEQFYTVNNLNQGTYIILIETEKGRVAKKLVKTVGGE